MPMIPIIRSSTFRLVAQSTRKMATISSSLPKVSMNHADRTAAEPRDNKLHTVILTQIDEVNSSIRLLRLSIPKEMGKAKGIRFLPGQWLDVFCPGIPKPGGFTITSPPSLALPDAQSPSDPYLELAIQNSPFNPPAAYFWRPIPEIMNSPIQIRVGGSFVWPPPISPSEMKCLKRLVFVAGGVGINPLISILSHIRELKSKGMSHPKEIIFVYSLKDPGNDVDRKTKVLFLDRVVSHLAELGGTLKLFLTGGEGQGDGIIEVDGKKIVFQRRRIGHQDILDVLGPVEDRADVVCYICGVPTMTDDLVDFMQKADGMDPRKVLCEKWW